MTSYLSSYFTSNASSGAAPQPHQTSSSGTASTWSSTFTSRIAILRNALTKDSEEDDADNEDCSHVSNVLRAYYTEKGRPFPEWLPPDPKKPIAPAPQPPGQYGQYGSTYGGQAVHRRGGSGGRADLSDLWESSSAPAAPSTQSLRPKRPTPQPLRSHDSTLPQASLSLPTANSARPLPSQKAGSYQTTASANAGVLGPRDRLRARLQGGGGGDRSSPSGGPGGGHASFGAPSGGHSSSQSRLAPSSPYVSASESGSSGGNQFGYDPGYSGGLSNPYNTPDYRPRPRAPR